MVIRTNKDRHPGRLERLGLPDPIIKLIRRAFIFWKEPRPPIISGLRLVWNFWKEPRPPIISGLRLVWKKRRELRPLINANSSLLFEGARYSADTPLLAGTDLSPEIKRE